MCVCIIQSSLNQSWELFHQDKKTIQKWTLNFPGKELNVTLHPSSIPSHVYSELFYP